MNPDDYCINVCKAKCCYWHDTKQVCPKLSADCTCSIYKRRFGPNSPHTEVVGWVRKIGTESILPFICGRINNIIADGQLPKEVEDQCCYAHPELLLEVKNEN